MLWYDKAAKKIYKYGGWPYSDAGNTYSQNLFSLTVDDTGKLTSSGWASSTASGANGLDNSGRAPGGAAFTYTNTTFFSLGGSSPGWTYAQSGLVQFDDASGKWTNTTSVGATSTGYWSNAAAAWASGFGSRGYLVFVGGAASETSPGFSSRSQLIDMSTVTLYDVNSGSWYQQPATGDIPPARNAFCYSSAATTGTFELFIYGGAVDADSVDIGNPTDTGYLNVYVLSLPAFRWFKSSDSTSVRRANHYCTTIGNRQMISIGGGQPSDPSNVLGQTNDPWPNGIGIFDMTAFKWSSSYDPNAARYESPNVVKSYYSSSYTTPTFANPTLAAAFGSRTSLSTSPTSSPSSSSPSPSSSSTASSGSSNHTGAIAGGVVGGVVGVALIVLVILFLRRRSRRTRAAAPAQQTDPRWMQGQGTPMQPQDVKPYDSGYAGEGTDSSYQASLLRPMPSEMGVPQLPVELSADPMHRGQSRFREMPG